MCTGWDRVNDSRYSTSSIPNRSRRYLNTSGQSWKGTEWLNCFGSLELILTFFKLEVRWHVFLIEQMIVDLDSRTKAKCWVKVSSSVVFQSNTWNLHGNDREGVSPGCWRVITRWSCDWFPTWGRSTWAHSPGKASLSDVLPWSASFWGCVPHSTWCFWYFKVDALQKRRKERVIHKSKPVRWCHSTRYTFAVETISEKISPLRLALYLWYHQSLFAFFVLVLSFDWDLSRQRKEVESHGLSLAEFFLMHLMGWQFYDDRRLDRVDSTAKSTSHV